MKWCAVVLGMVVLLVGVLEVKGGVFRDWLLWLGTGEEILDFAVRLGTMIIGGVCTFIIGRRRRRTNSRHWHGSQIQLLWWDIGIDSIIIGIICSIGMGLVRLRILPSVVGELSTIYVDLSPALIRGM